MLHQGHLGSERQKLLFPVEAFDVLVCTCNLVVKELDIADAARTTLNPINPAWNWVMYVCLEVELRLS